ncbi:hypothetical protein E3N88_37897 [Mikania micrantha]|uniref:Uncharacterized protein n=1 Tax=Mikania micrantha TaxID=192012 RepID=A0A5N6LSP0_9ASTR|nr:hypothetical protein E3N88_37897 [Mikania micrantha]
MPIYTTAIHTADDAVISAWWPRIGDDAFVRSARVTREGADLRGVYVTRIARFNGLIDMEPAGMEAFHPVRLDRRTVLGMRIAQTFPRDMEMQRQNGGDNCWNQRFNRGFLMESLPHSKLFCNDSSASLMQPLSVFSCGGASIVGDGRLGYIEHTVTKFDTLAGVAIKYGVEEGIHLLPSCQMDVLLKGNTSLAAGKGLALRPKAASRTANDSDGLQNMPSLKLGDSLISDAFSGVKKSSSSPSFYDSYNNSNSYSNNGNGTSVSSIWPTSMLNLTVELQALSTAAITRPIFDGLPRPMSGRKNKAAID